MRTYNRVILMGRLGADAEVKFFGESAVINFNLATERRVKSPSGEWASETDWHRVSAWRVENLAPYLLKGKVVLVEGQIKYRKYSKDGVERTITEIQGDNITLVSQSSPEGQGAKQQPASGEFGSAPTTDGFIDDDIPF